MLLRNIDRNVGYRFVERVQQDPGFHAAAASILNKHHPFADLKGDRLAMLSHDFQLGASWIVLVKIANPIEQLGATLVVQVLARQSLFRL